MDGSHKRENTITEAKDNLLSSICGGECFQKQLRGYRFVFSGLSARRSFAIALVDRQVEQFSSHCDVPFGTQRSAVRACCVENYVLLSFVGNPIRHLSAGDAMKLSRRENIFGAAHVAVVLDLLFYDHFFIVVGRAVIVGQLAVCGKQSAMRELGPGHSVRYPDIEQDAVSLPALLGRRFRLARLLLGNRLRLADQAGPVDAERVAEALHAGLLLQLVVGDLLEVQLDIVDDVLRTGAVLELQRRVAID